MIKIDSKNYISQGIYMIDNKYLKIEELPVGYWTQDFKNYLEDFVYKTKYFSSYQDNGTESTVEIYLKINDLNEIQKLDSKVDNYGLSDLSKLLKLNKTVKLSNMHLYDSQGKIKKYNSVKEILEEYYTVRLGYYQKRKDYLMEKLDKETKIFDSQVKFITGLISNKIKISNKSKQDIINILKKEKLYLIKDEPEYEYLTRMPIYSFSKEKVEDLNRKYNDKKNEYNLLKNKTINQLWLADLNFF
jgi:DNA topoisomerase-2